jgi:glycosyltransferase involved in cell wall biosynthesis
MRPGEPVLLICHGFPPIRGVGGRRWAKFAKELARRGHPVHVIRNAGVPADRTSLWTTEVQHPLIHHHPLPQRFPSVMTKRPLTTFGEKLMYRFWCKVLPLLAKGNWRDVTVLWQQQLLAEASRLVQQQNIRQVIVTGAPFRLMRFGAELKQRLPQIRLVLDFRDEWTWAGHYGLASMGPQRNREEAALEASAMAAADAVISPHRAVLDHLEKAYAGSPARFHLVPHTVDPDDFDLTAPPKADGLFRMIYAGSLYGDEEARAYFTELLKALGSMGSPDAGATRKFRCDLYITGHDTRWYEEQVAARNLTSVVHFHPRLPPKEVFKEIHAADLVIAFIPHVNRNILGTKFQEIFYCGTPLLHVGDAGLVGRTILEKRMGGSITVAELAVELPRIIRGERVVSCDRHADHRSYLLPQVTDLLVNEVLG